MGTMKFLLRKLTKIVKYKQILCQNQAKHRKRHFSHYRVHRNKQEKNSHKHRKKKLSSFARNSVCCFFVHLLLNKKLIPSWQMPKRPGTLIHQNGFFPTVYPQRIFIYGVSKNVKTKRMYSQNSQN